MDREIRFFDNPVQIITRDGESESRTVEGYALKFEQLSRNLGWFREKIARGALDNADMGDVVALFNHDNNMVLARTISKTLTLEIDNEGLKYRFEAPNTTVGNDLIEMLSRGDIQHSSFAFSVEDQKWEQDGEDGAEIRTILKIKRLYDVSAVTQPAYLQPDVGLAKRSYDEYKKENKGEPDEPTAEVQLRAKERARFLEIEKNRY